MTGRLDAASARRPHPAAVSRRAFLGRSAAAAAAATGLVLVGFDRPARAAGALPGFPDSVPVHKAVFENWDGAIVTDALWTATPSTSADVVELCNWAHSNGWTVRPSGRRHTWSPLTVPAATSDGARVLLIDTSKLAEMTLGADHRVQVGAGALMSDLLAYLSRNGRGVVSAPAPGDVTVGGVLAVGGHGTAIPAAGEKTGSGTTFGSVSNLVSAITAVVWDAAAGRYVARTVRRDHPDCAALMTHLGRAFVLDAELITVPEQFLRCQSRTDITADDLFAPPATAGPTALSNLIDAAGRVGIIWYAFTDRPWVQIWTPTSARPTASRHVDAPFNFTFADQLPDPVPRLLGRLIEGHGEVAPQFGPAMLAATEVGLDVTGTRDMWGAPKNFQHFVRPTTLRVTAASHVVVTARSELQSIVHDFTTVVRALLERYRARGQYPINGPVEIRVTGIDDPAHTGISGAAAPALSAAAPVDGHPEWDTAIWLDTLTLPGTAGHPEFYRDLEVEFFDRFPAGRGRVRPEWAKRWAHTPAGAWTDAHTLDTVIPRAFDQWDNAVRTLARLDPHRLFTTDLLDRLRL